MQVYRYQRRTIQYIRGRAELSIEDEREYYKKNVQFGPDGSILRDGDWVYHVRWHEVLQIDYFHGMSSMYGRAICQTMEDEDDVVAPFYGTHPKMGAKTSVRHH